MTPARPPAAIRTIEGTIVFTDIAGFTEFTALRGDAEALALLSTQDQIVRDEIESRGRVVKELGDGLMLWFADPRDAIAAALAIQERFEADAQLGDLPLWMRAGVHFGRPARRGRDLVGHDVNVAARIVDLAGPGEVLASQACVDRVGADLPEISFEQVGPTVMKGIPSPIPLYRAVRQATP